jgi:formate dehydrogenase iron-sulfur subunit
MIFDLREAGDGRQDPADAVGYLDHPERVGFFTDTSVCIGCKACEVACKEWNAIPEDGLHFTGMSYDNTIGLGADSWRHVAFVEQPRRLGRQETHLAPTMVPVDIRELAARRDPVSLGMPAPAPPDGHAAGDGRIAAVAAPEFRWLMSSDVCKHCTHAACLDVCPTGSLFRTEFGTVVVQQDVCNGCGYCVPACPYGVIDIRPGDGRAWKCTLCYDRLSVGQEPACAKSCPTDSIQFGDLAELRQRAERRATCRRGHRRPALRGGPHRRGRRCGRVLPAARRPRGLRPAAGPRGDHP